MDIDCGYCQLLLRWSIDYQPVSTSLPICESKRLASTDGTQNICRGALFLRSSLKISCSISIHSCSSPPEKDKMLWQNTSHPFSELSIHIHTIYEQKHRFSYKATCGTLGATHKAGSETASIFKTSLLCRDDKKRTKKQQQRSYGQQLNSTNKSFSCSQISSILTRKQVSKQVIGPSLVCGMLIVLRLFRQKRKR